MDMRSVRSWLALAIAAGLATPALAGVEDGVRKWRAGDYAGAVAEWKEPAAKGNREAQFNLGQAYKLGSSVAADPPKAIEFYRKADNAGTEKTDTICARIHARTVNAPHTLREKMRQQLRRHCKDRS